MQTAWEENTQRTAFNAKLELLLKKQETIISGKEKYIAELQSTIERQEALIKEDGMKREVYELQSQMSYIMRENHLSRETATRVERRFWKRGRRARGRAT